MATNQQDEINEAIINEIKGYMLEAPGLRFTQILNNLGITNNSPLSNQELLDRVQKARQREREEN